MATPEELKKLQRPQVTPKVAPLIAGNSFDPRPFAERKIPPMIGGENTAGATPLGLPSVAPVERPVAAPEPVLRSQSAPKGLEGMKELGGRIAEGFKGWNEAEGTPYERSGLTPRPPQGPRVASVGGSGVPPAEAPVPGMAPAAMGQVAKVWTPAGTAEKITGPNGMTTATLEGGSMSGIDRPGGSFRVQAGEASAQPGYAQMTNEQKIAANVAAIKAQAPKAATPNAAGQSQTQTEGIHNPTMQEAMQDYAAGRVGSEGYKMIRNLNMKARQDLVMRKRDAMRAAQQIPNGRYRKMALRDIAKGMDTGDAVATALSNSEADETEDLSFADKMDAMRLQMTQQRNEREAARDQRQDDIAKEQINYERKRDQAKDVESLRELGLSELDQMAEQGMIAPELSQGFREMVFAGEDPFLIQQHMQQLQKANPELAKAMESDRPVIRRQAAEKILAAIEAQRGASQ